MLPLSPPKQGSKTQNGRFWYKIALRLKKVCYRVSLCENCQQQSCKAFIGLAIRANMIFGGGPFYLKFLAQTDHVGAKSLIFDLFSPVAPHLSKKFQLTLIRSPLRAFQWAQDEHRTLSLSPQSGAQKRKLCKIWTVICDNSKTVRDRMSVTINH